MVQIPGISYMASMAIIVEIGIDMEQFETDKQLACWAGLSPANNESANQTFTCAMYFSRNQI